ncbi:E3 ubiquitin-protein ligase TRIM39-like [Littorina saxatilis]|uniref:E3 ubiquitin-protein ligase TRIM39-like n=1 Tax=Littorina saxatilis TaxID=31220 RepID=UPI0038B598C3
MAELYCSDHEVVICLLCASSSHRKCPDVGGIGEAAQTRREELKKQAERLKQKETAAVVKMAELDQELTDGKVKFKAIREEVNTTFDDLQKHLDARRHKLLTDVQQREDAYVLENTTSKTDLDKFRGKSSAHAGIMGRLVTAPDEVLLGTLSKLKARLDDLDSEKLCGCDRPQKKSAKVGSISFDAKSLTGLKKSLDDCGSISDTTQQDDTDSQVAGPSAPSETEASEGEPIDLQPQEETQEEAQETKVGATRNRTRLASPYS